MVYNILDITKYRCSHCLEEFVDKDKAEEHSASRECLSKKFQCGTCTMEYKNASLLQRHKCGGKPKYERFYCNNFNNTVNTMKIAMVMMMILIINKSFFHASKKS